MFLNLNSQSGLPIYRQMLQQFRERIASGQLTADSQLPSVRELSAELHINPLTVGKVYQFLEREGLVEFRRGQGTFVTSGRKAASVVERQNLIKAAVDQVVSEALHLDISETQLQRLVRQAYENKRK